ncbi:MAG: transposase [Nocardioidaceae bacterium]|jgi:transposase|nr:transposase [Nocardioidaceae bacterium]
MTDITTPVDLGGIIVGVDTHKDNHVAVAIDPLGRRVAQRTVSTDRAGLVNLLEWSQQLNATRTWGVEGTGSYGVGLTRLLQRSGEPVHEVSRPNRRLRRERGKSDPIDAEAAARSVLAHHGVTPPKADNNPSESLRQLRATRRSAVKARTQAANLLQALLVTAPDDLRANLRGATLIATINTCSRLRPADRPSPREACKLSLRSTARRWQHLNAEIADLTAAIASITATAAPQLLDLFGVGPDVAATLLITVGGNPERMRTERSFAALCGVSPIPASSGKTHRHRLNRGGDRQANAAIHIVALSRLRSDTRTRAYAARRTEDGLSKRDIMRCLKRYIARELYTTIRAATPLDQT